MSKESEIIFYKGDDGNIKIEVFYHDETFWMTQKSISELFGVLRPAITKHIKNIFDSGELVEKSVCSILEHTAEDGKKYNTAFYNLDVIIAVGYRVNSSKATKFRIWATKVLKEFITKGFVLDDERLKQGKQFGKDYFDELLERIREVRQVKEGFIKKLLTYIRFQLIMTNLIFLPRIFLLQSKIDFIGQLQVKWLRKSYTHRLMLQRFIWD